MDFRTKYGIGDKCWIMKDNKPKELTVNSIYISHYSNKDTYKKIKIEYGLALGQKFDETTCYHTKKELLDSL